MKYHVKINSTHHAELINHLFPGDGKEALAFVLCGYSKDQDQTTFYSHKVIPIPHSICDRNEQWVTWPTDYTKPILEESERNDWFVLKVHSHPSGYDKFSETDNYSDHNYFDFAYSWQSDQKLFASAVLLPSGQFFARVIEPDLKFKTCSKAEVFGQFSSLHSNTEIELQNEDLRNVQAFGEGTVNHLKGICATVVGCSGTGSVVIEQLYRLGIGKLILIDPEPIEDVNLNRIINSTKAHAESKVRKVDMFKSHITESGLKTEVETFASNLCSDVDAQKALSRSDVVFGCVDSAEGRWTMNEIATSFLIPYIDVGVLLRADANGGIEEISGAIHYFTPGLSSVLSRGLITSEMLRAESTARTNPEEYEQQIKNGYIQNFHVASPAVISVNMFASSLMILEFLARLHPFRYASNFEFARTMISVSDWSLFHSSEDEFKPDLLLPKLVGIGDKYFTQSNHY